MGVGALYSFAEAVALLPFADGKARRWLLAHGLVREVEGRRVVRWLDVLFHPDLGGPPVEADPSAPMPPRARLARTPLATPQKATGARITRSGRNTRNP